MNAAQAVALYTARHIREFLEDEWNWGNSAPRDKARSAAAIVARDAKLRERDVREGARLLMGELYRFAGVRACVKCGCTDDVACDGGCAWVSRPHANGRGEIVGDNLCSSCAPPRPRRRARR